MTLTNRKTPRPKILYCAEIPTPYRDPVFQKLMEDPEIVFYVLYVSQRQKSRQWQLPSLNKERVFFARAPELMTIGAYTLFGLGDVRKILNQVKPEVVVLTGYAQPISWLMRRMLLRLKIPYLTFTESHDLKKRSIFIRTLKKIALRTFYRKAAGHLVMGEPSARYVKSLGAKEDKLIYFPNTIDVQAYAQRVNAAAKPISKEAPVRFLYVGNLEKWKGVDLLFEAFCQFQDSAAEVATLELVGSGSRYADLTQKAQEQNRSDIFFRGFVSSEALPAYYAHTDVVVVPSLHETWGTVVIEAMAAGKVIICSDSVGAARSMLAHNQSAWFFKQGDVEDLARTIDKAVNSPVQREKLGIQARKIADQWSQAVAVENFKQLVLGGFSAK